MLAGLQSFQFASRQRSLEAPLLMLPSFGIFRACGNPLKGQASPIAGRGKKIKCPRFDILRSARAETFQMTLTVAHISPIISVIAGLLILIMPRLLNFIVAIFLILNGLIGLGLLKWLHF
jgi:hypothetical protein